jgi:hypothetical protein
MTLPIATTVSSRRHTLLIQHCWGEKASSSGFAREGCKAAQLLALVNLYAV